jgi:hypothetical protein
MCKEMPVIPVNRVVDTKKNNPKNGGQGGGKSQGVADPSPPPQKMASSKLALCISIFLFEQKKRVGVGLLK